MTTMIIPPIARIASQGVDWGGVHRSQGRRKRRYFRLIFKTWAEDVISWAVH